MQGRPQNEIATDVGVSQPAVSKILRREYDRRLQRLPRERVRLLARHYARYEYLYRLAHEGLDRSRADMQRRDQRRTTRGATDSGESMTVSVSTVSAPGDPRWVREMLRALSDEQKLFQGNDFDWKILAMLFVEEEDGTVRVNEQFLTDADREVLRKAQVRPPNPTSSR